MGVYGYADDISLLAPTITGLQEMLRICEAYAIKYKITFNAKKSQVLCFNSKSNKKPNAIPLRMTNGQLIPYIDTCIHLGNKLCTTNNNICVDQAVTDLNVRLNNLLSDFSHCSTNTLSILFKTYCMNIYGSQIWKYNDKYVSKFYTAWRKPISQVWKLPNITHNKLIHLINDSYSINIILEKRCIKYIWNLINSGNNVYKQIIHHSLYNCTTTLGENIKYFMYKYRINQSDWNGSINVVFNKIDIYADQHTNINDKCTATAVRELCETRDMCDTQFFDRGELKVIIHNMCTL